MPKCVEPPPTKERIIKHLNTYAAGVAPMMFSCVACESSLCIACPSCGRGPIDEALEKEKR